jgi:hypothetical protein
MKRALETQSRRARRRTLSILALVLLSGSLSAQLPLVATESDSYRVELEDLERVLASVWSSPETNAAVMVEGSPVLTDRGFIHLSAADFTPWSTDTSGTYYWSFYFFGGVLHGDGAGSYDGATAAVHLPEGVTVDAVFLTAVDDWEYDSGVTLTRRLAFAESTDGMADVDTDGNSAGVGLWIDDSIDHPVIQNGLYQYELQAYPMTDDIWIRSVFIYYSY